MMIPSVKHKSNDPSGLFPKWTSTVILGAITLLVVIASMFSGKSKKNDPVTPVSPLGASVEQLKAFQEALNKEKQRVELEKVRQDEQQRAEGRSRAMPFATPNYYPQPPAVLPLTDPFEQRRKERAENAAFADNVVLAVPRPEPQRVQPVEVIPAVQSADASPVVSSRMRGSGRFLADNEDGDLFRVYEGTLVETRLTNQLDGTFTGPVKCEVVRNVMSRDGKVVLIPSGAEFFGVAHHVEAQDQQRLAVTFRRLLLPNGYSVDLDNTPGLNDAGETGLKDKTDHHYLRSFGMSGAVGLLGGLALYGGQSSSAPYAAGFANSAGSSATTILSHFLNTVPTITIRAGHPVKVYISQDLLLPQYRQ